MSQRKGIPVALFLQSIKEAGRAVLLRHGRKTGIGTYRPQRHFSETFVIRAKPLKRKEGKRRG